jgi:hypothetical protein
MILKEIGCKVMESNYMPQISADEPSRFIKGRIFLN